MIALTCQQARDRVSQGLPVWAIDRYGLNRWLKTTQVTENTPEEVRYGYDSDGEQLADVRAVEAYYAGFSATPPWPEPFAPHVETEYARGWNACLERCRERERVSKLPHTHKV